MIGGGLIVALLALAATAGAAATSLSPRWRPGQEYPHQLVFTQSSLTLMSGREPVRQEVRLSQEFNLREVRTNRLGGVDLEVHWREARAAVSTLGDRERTLPPARLPCTLDAKNRVARVEGLAQWQALAFGAEPAPMRGVLQGLFSERFLRDWVELGCDVPAFPMTPGQRWETRGPLPLDALGEATLERTFTVEKLQTNAAVLSFRGKILPPTHAGAPTLGGLVAVTGGAISGRFELDPARAVITSATLERTLTLVTTLPTRASVAPDAPWQEQTITNVLNQSASWRLTLPH